MGYGVCPFYNFHLLSSYTPQHWYNLRELCIKDAEISKQAKLLILDSMFLIETAFILGSLRNCTNKDKIWPSSEKFKKIKLVTE